MISLTCIFVVIFFEQYSSTFIIEKQKYNIFFSFFFNKCLISELNEFVIIKLINFVSFYIKPFLKVLIIRKKISSKLFEKKNLKFHKNNDLKLLNIIKMIKLFKNIRFR